VGVTAAAMAHTASPASSQTAKSMGTYCQRGRRLVHGSPSFSSSDRQNVRRLISPIPLMPGLRPEGTAPLSLRRRRSAMSCAVLTESSLSGADTANPVLTTAVDTERPWTAKDLTRRLACGEAGRRQRRAQPPKVVALSG
jgi:hypothetical protein